MNITALPPQQARQFKAEFGLIKPKDIYLVYRSKKELELGKKLIDTCIQSNPDITYDACDTHPYSITVKTK